MVKVIKPEPGWAVVHWTGRIYLESVARTRKQAIANFLHWFVGRGKTWKSQSEYGVHKAIKIEVILAGTSLSRPHRGTP